MQIIYYIDYFTDSFDLNGAVMSQQKCSGHRLVNYSTNFKSHWLNLILSRLSIIKFNLKYHRFAVIFFTFSTRPTRDDDQYATHRRYQTGYNVGRRRKVPPLRNPEYKLLCCTLILISFHTNGTKVLGDWLWWLLGDVTGQLCHNSVQLMCK